jgi:hypothetical protein
MNYLGKGEDLIVCHQVAIIAPLSQPILTNSQENCEPSRFGVVDSYS